MNGTPERSGARAHASPAGAPQRRARPGRWGEERGWGGGVPAHAGEPLSGTEAGTAFDAARRDHGVAVVGMGAFSPLGRNCGEMKRALLDGRDSIGKVTRFGACRFLGDLASSFGDEVPVEIDADARSWMDRATLLTVEAYREAIRQAGVGPGDFDPDRIGVCLGSSHSGLVRTEDVAQHVLRGEWCATAGNLTAR